MTPDKLAKSGSEHGHQTALFAFVAMARLRGWAWAWAWANDEPCDFTSPPVLALEWFHAIHNQGHGDAIRGARAKAEGVRKGVADTFLPWPSANCAGLYIEMKKPSEKPKSQTAKGGLSEDQSKFAEYAKSVGYAWVVCYSWREAAQTLQNYIEWGNNE